MSRKGGERMFYLKHNGKKLLIESDNVYTQCPRCGREFPFDLSDAVTDGQLDLYGLSFYCEECGKVVSRTAPPRS